MKLKGFFFIICEAVAAQSIFVKIDQSVQQLRARGWAQAHTLAYAHTQKSNMWCDVLNLFFLERLAKNGLQCPQLKN